MVVFSTGLTAVKDRLNGFSSLPFPAERGGEEANVEQRGRKGEGLSPTIDY